MSRANRSVSAATKSFNRIAAIMLHCVRYSCFGTSRLASDAGLAKSTVSQSLHGKTNPLYSTVERIVKCLSREIGRPLPLDEVISFDGNYPTPHVCELVGCPRCLPDQAYHPDGSRKDEWRQVLPGHWTGDLNELRSHQTRQVKGGS